MVLQLKPRFKAAPLYWRSDTHSSVKMAKRTNTAINAKLISNKLAATRSKRVKNNLKASNNLLCHVENEKKSETKRRR